MSVGPGCSVNTAKKHYILAEKLWTDGKYAASVAEFDKVTAKDPRGKLGLQALYRAANTQALFLSAYPDAVRKYRHYIETRGDLPNSPFKDLVPAWEAEKQLAEILFSKTEQYEQAIQQYQAMLKQNPDAPEAPEFLFRIGKSHFFLWQFDEAIQEYEAVLKKYPHSPWAERAAFEMGVSYFTRGEQRPEPRGPGMEPYRQAIDAYNRFLKAYPQSSLTSEARFGIASCLEELDQIDSAYDAYEALLKTYPSPNVIRIKLARLHERKTQRSR